MPIGYVYLTADELKGWDRPNFHVAFWVRGDAYNFNPTVPQRQGGGQEDFEGQEVGKAGCESDIDNNTTHYVADTVPQKAKWSRVSAASRTSWAWTSPATITACSAAHVLNANPGEYELKVLWNNKLARSVKFNVAADGKFDNGIASANKLGSDRVIVPVQVIGDQDGQWDKAAWKTDAFYGNPLTGFTALP